jgi:hypothetical protein
VFDNGVVVGALVGGGPLQQSVSHLQSLQEQNVFPLFP